MKLSKLQKFSRMKKCVGGKELGDGKQYMTQQVAKRHHEQTKFPDDNYKVLNTAMHTRTKT